MKWNSILLARLAMMTSSLTACSSTVFEIAGLPPEAGVVNDKTSEAGVFDVPTSEAGVFDGGAAGPCGSDWFDRKPGGDCPAVLESKTCFGNTGVSGTYLTCCGGSWTPYVPPYESPTCSIRNDASLNPVSQEARDAAVSD
jgi:hypothetical protein